jgi:hypothetical protein
LRGTVPLDEQETKPRRCTFTGTETISRSICAMLGSQHFISLVYHPVYHADAWPGVEWNGSVGYPDRLPESGRARKYRMTRAWWSLWVEAPRVSRGTHGQWGAG